MFKQIARWFITAAAVAAAAAAASAAATAPVRQAHFATAQAALEALVAAERADNQPRLLALFGAGGAKLIHSGDPVEDKAHLAHFVSAYDEAHKIHLESDRIAIVSVGAADWPFPIPLVREKRGWRFDTLAGEREILNRRIGHNELKVIDVCREYVQAQREYAALNPGGKHQFAQRFVSTTGSKDGLYWPASAPEPESPLGPLVAEAKAGGYTDDGSAATAHAKSTPFYGYYFRILTEQGPSAPGGARSYVDGDGLKKGFALVAYPATYGDSGIMTFVVNQNGIVFEKNLGPDTQRIASQMLRYDPDTTWRAAP